MSVRVGHILRHEDVHGVSGVGKVADVWEASNGVCVLVWRSAHSSTNIYPNIKALETTHSHGGKTLVIWDYESPPDPDPMDKPVATKSEPLTDQEMDEIAEEAATEIQAKTAAKVVEKLAEKAAEKKEEPLPSNGDDPEEETT